MLVISRKLKETVRIGDGIRVTIAYIRGDRIGLGIEAPREIPIHREKADASEAGRQDSNTKGL